MPRESVAASELPSLPLLHLQAPAGHVQAIALAGLAQESTPQGRQAREALLYFSQPEAVESLRRHPDFYRTLLGLQEGRSQPVEATLANMAGFLSGAGSRHPAIASVISTVEGEKLTGASDADARAEKIIAALPQLFDGMNRRSETEVKHLKDSQDAVLALFSLADQTLQSHWGQKDAAAKAIEVVDGAISKGHFHVQDDQSQSFRVAIPEIVKEDLPHVRAVLASIALIAKDQFSFRETLMELAREAVEAMRRAVEVEDAKSGLNAVLKKYDAEKMADLIVYSGGLQVSPARAAAVVPAATSLWRRLWAMVPFLRQRETPAVAVPQTAVEAEPIPQLQKLIRQMDSPEVYPIVSAALKEDPGLATLSMKTEIAQYIDLYMQNWLRHSVPGASVPLGSRYAPPQRIRELINLLEQITVAQPRLGEPLSLETMPWLDPAALKMSNREFWQWRGGRQYNVGGDLFLNPTGYYPDLSLPRTQTLIWVYRRMAQFIETVDRARPDALSPRDFSRFFSFILGMRKEPSASQLGEPEKKDLDALTERVSLMLADKALADWGMPALAALNAIAEFDDVERHWQAKPGFKSAFSMVGGRLDPDVIKTPPNELYQKILAEVMP